MTCACGKPCPISGRSPQCAGCRAEARNAAEKAKGRVRG